MQLKLLAAAGLAMLISVPAGAQDDEEEVVYGWSGSGEFGLVRTTGNTDSEVVAVAGPVDDPACHAVDLGTGLAGGARVNRRLLSIEHDRVDVAYLSGKRADGKGAGHIRAVAVHDRAPVHEKRPRPDRCRIRTVVDH